MSTPDSVASPNPKEQILARLIARLDRFLGRGDETSARFSRWRMATFLTGLVSCIVLYNLEHYHLGNAALALFILTFTVIASYHNRLEGRLHRLRVWRTIKQGHLARLRLDWQTIPKTEGPSVDAHPYAADVDLIGPHSLFTLLNTTLSSNGRERLGGWLLDQNTHPPGIGTWQCRQALVKELSGLHLLRDRLTLEAALVDEGGIDGDRLIRILQAPAGFAGLVAVLLVQTTLAACTISLGLAAALGLIPAYWTLSFSVYAIVWLLMSGRAAPAFGRALSIHKELEKVGAIYRYLGRRSFDRTPSLRGLVAPVLDAAAPPEVYIKRFARVSHALSIRAHHLVHLGLNALVPWDFWCAFRLERLQREVLPEIPIWIDTLAELEAAAALGNFAYLHPAYAWPVLAPPGDNGQSAVFAARSLGHPLIPHGQRVSNDVELRGRGRILLVTGSNMSGKSTFLRTFGINACLAQAGAPVCADRLEASWVRLHCCIRVDDSLEAGLSFFYAEVKRLKGLLDAAQDHSAPPVLFLIDEIFKGTNNRERVIGSRAFIQALAASNGFGLVTTHDLELAELEKDTPALSNAHFQETVTAKSLTFDYRLRTGPCPTTNALRIMALEGLPVPQGDP